MSKKKLFKEIKEEFIKEPILRIYQLRLLIRVKINTLDFVLEVYIVQRYNNRVQYSVAYYSRKMIPPKLNYNIYDKELLIIVTALKKQRVFLQGIIKPFIIKTNYKNLTGFLTTKELN